MEPICCLLFIEESLWIRVFEDICVGTAWRRVAGQFPETGKKMTSGNRDQPVSCTTEGKNREENDLY